MTVRLSVVSYLNTLPFVHGLLQEQHKLADTQISLDYPAECARKLIEGEVDLGLIPVAAIPEIATPYIVSEYCIGAKKHVNSVLLVSRVPLAQIRCIYLDYQSRSSVALSQILAREYWHISPIWEATTQGYENRIGADEAAVVIGDRAFEMLHFPYIYDLATEWYKLTKCPFVFAAWVSNKELPSAFLQSFNRALGYGLDHKADAIRDYLSAHPNCRVNLSDYLTNDISYELDVAKRKGLDLFLAKLNALPEQKNSSC
jgi:chorismate dehydratase